MKSLFAAGMILLSSWSGLLWAESLEIVNRTGFDIELVQGAAAGVDSWGADLIASSVIRNREAEHIDIQGPPPYAFRLMDTEGTVYVLYGVSPGSLGKVIVGPEHQARLAVFAGAERKLKLSNKTGATISSIRLSSTSDRNWGPDVLNGRIIRDGETSQLTIQAVPGTLSFDLRFTLSGTDGETVYEKSNLILTDGASLVLSIPLQR